MCFDFGHSKVCRHSKSNISSDVNCSRRKRVCCRKCRCLRTSTMTTSTTTTTMTTPSPINQQKAMRGFSLLLNVQVQNNIEIENRLSSRGKHKSLTLKVLSSNPIGQINYDRTLSFITLSLKLYNNQL